MDSAPPVRAEDVPALWCRACGHDTNLPDAVCGQCATPVVGPDPGPPRIGRVVNLGNRFLPKYAIVIGETADGVSLLGKGDGLTPMPLAQFDALTAEPAPPVIGAAGRLWAAGRARIQGTLKGKWSQEPTDKAALDFAAVSLGTRRAAALDALALGMTGWEPLVNLSATEIAWYKAWFAATMGDTSGLLAALETLPEHLYGARISLLLKHAPALLADSALGARACPLTSAFVGSSLDARALTLALGSVADPRVVTEFVGRYAVAVPTSAGPVADTAAAVVARHAVPDALAAPDVRAFAAYVAVDRGGSVDQSLDALGPLPLELVDDLIERRALTRVSPGTALWDPATTAYVRARLHAGEVTDGELTLAGFTAELARRAYLAGDSTRLSALEDTDPAVAHYRALLAFKRKRSVDNVDSLRPDERRIVTLLAEMREPAADGRRSTPLPIALDPSTWPLLRDYAYRGELSIDDDVRVRCPEFAVWLDLCRTQRLLFEARWDAAVMSGRSLLTTTTSEALQDEAQNMIAFAEWQLGHPDEALRVLDQALAGQFTNGLVVNAALVASDRGCRIAFPYLTKAMRLATDPRVRQGAVSRAIACWLADDSVQDYPEPLAEMIREALGTAQPDDDFHRVLVRLTMNNDHDWLAQAHATAASPAQNEMLSYFVVKARGISKGYPETLVAAAKRLVALWGTQPRPAWMQPEIDWFAELLQDVVHEDFGSATGASEIIETLNSGHVLPLLHELTLGAQAAAHITTALAEADDMIAASAEQRMLFATLRTFATRGHEFDEVVHKLVAKELALCASTCAFFFMMSVSKTWDARADTWAELNRRQQWDYQNAGAIMRNKCEILTELGCYVARCQAYVKAMDAMPLSDKDLERRRTVVSHIGDWSDQIARLQRTL